MKLHTFRVTIKAPDDMPNQMLEKYVHEALAEWRKCFNVNDKIFTLKSANISVRRITNNKVEVREP